MPPLVCSQGEVSCTILQLDNEIFHLVGVEVTFVAAHAILNRKLLRLTFHNSNDGLNPRALQFT
jgi:hypothetical protein